MDAGKEDIPKEEKLMEGLNMDMFMEKPIQK
jgi:hypothetical protein